MNPWVNCPVGKYHWFVVKSSPYTNNSKTQIENCKFCSVRKEYGFKDDGSMIDEQAYFKDHIRAFAQPSMGEVYFDCNPGMKEKLAAKQAEQAKRDIRNLETDERFQFAIKKALDNKGENER